MEADAVGNLAPVSPLSRSFWTCSFLLGLTLAACGSDGPGPDGSSPVLDAGPEGCASDSECDDDVDCTQDTCESGGSCRHMLVPALCPAGASCHPMRGCEMGRPCADDTDCADEDACTVNEHCDPAARVCVVDPLDGDGDGDPPRVCGGGDCDDSLDLVFQGAPERCNATDDDCDGDVDEGLDAASCAFCRTVNGCHDQDMHACYVGVEEKLDQLACTNRDAVASALGACASSSCSEYSSCRDAAIRMCECVSGQTLCVEGSYSTVCADTMTDPGNCGSCGHSCAPDVPCEGGRCQCSTGLTSCGSSCTDTMTDDANCGSCGHSCGPDLSCVGGTCVCPPGLAVCGAACVDTNTSYDHCGGCDQVCPGASCSSGVCQWRSGCGAPENTVLCGGIWACLQSDPANCGSCGVVCDRGRYCDAGTCI